MISPKWLELYRYINNQVDIPKQPEDAGFSEVY